MTEPTKRRETAQGCTLLVVASVLVVATIFPDVASRPTDERLAALLLPLGSCLLAALAVGLWARRSATGWSWLRFGSLFVFLAFLFDLLRRLVTGA